LLEGLSGKLSRATLIFDKFILDSEQMSIGSLTALAADTSFNTTNIDLVGLSQTGLEYV